MSTQGFSLLLGVLNKHAQKHGIAPMDQTEVTG